MDQNGGREERAPAGALLADLLRRVAAGDALAFRRLYEMQVRRLNGVALRITRDPAIARDVLHDAFLEIWRHAGQFDPARGSAETWLLSVVRHRALTIARRRRRETLGYEPVEAADDAPDPLARLQASADGDALRRCLSELDPKVQQLFVLAYVDGLSHAQLAERLQLPLGTIKSSIRRGIQSLRMCLQR